MAEENMEQIREGFLPLLLQRIAQIIKDAHIEASEWAAIVLHAMWFIPLLFDSAYLRHSPFARIVVEHIPGETGTVFFITGLMLSFHTLAFCLGGPPSFLIKREEDQQLWYKMRIVGMIASWLWFSLIALLFTSVQITAGSILFGSGAIAAYVGSHKLYMKMRSSWNYLLFRNVRSQVESIVKEELLRANIDNSGK